MALAPSFFLFGVPSSSIIRWSMAIWSSASMPMSSSAMTSLTLATAFDTPLPSHLRLVAVAQLPGLVGAGAGAAGDGGGAGRAVGERDVDLDGGIAAAIENLAAANIDDRAHGGSVLLWWGVRVAADPSF